MGFQKDNDFFNRRGSQSKSQLNSVQSQSVRVRSGPGSGSGRVSVRSGPVPFGSQLRISANRKKNTKKLTKIH
jgi:hypothetical protein